ncbi:hypothetical protein DFH11DRAFT_1882900, partial [Phellopilus nigrolimitatus]
MYLHSYMLFGPMPKLPFQGFEPMSVYVTFSDYKSRGRRNLGILLTRDERSDPPAEHFRCQIETDSHGE